MRLHVAFLPHLVWPGRQVSIVIDVIRASTSLITLVDRGASRILIASDVPTARALAAKYDGAVLAGEEEGVAPPGFEYGNSPVELSRATVTDRPVLFVTTNGTAAIRAAEEHGPVLVGALRNSAAVTSEAREMVAEEQSNLTIVCAGREGVFGIDDAYTAGCLASRLMDQHRWTLTDSTEAALRLFRSEPDPLALLRVSAAGQNVIGLGLAPDVEYCAEIDRSRAVPKLGRELAIVE